MGFRAFAAAIAVVALFAIPASALAQTIGPTSDQYDPTSERVEVGVGGGSGDPPGDSSESSSRVVSGLPFTGLDVGLLAAVAAGLGAGGFALRRAAASRAGS